MISRSRLGAAGLCTIALLLAACGYGVTGEATDIGSTSATLTGVADRTEPGEITYWFEYGTTAAYGMVTESQTVEIVAPIPVEAVVVGLDPHTTYHYRICVDDDEGVGTCGKDQTFSTAGLTVNHAGDAPDAQPGDGSCQDQGAAAGRCSLRAAVQEANARIGDDTVVVQPGIGTVALTRGELVATGVLTVKGNGVTVDAGGTARVLRLGSGQLTLERVTLTGGRALTGGGLLVGPGATANVVESTIAGNESTGLYSCSQYFSGVSPGIPVGCSGVGGGAGIFSSGTLHLSRSTVTQNHAIGGGCVSEPIVAGYVETCSWSQGAGLHSAGGTVVDSTISRNWSDGGSGNALTATTGTVAISRSTIVDNAGGSPTQLDVCCTSEGMGLPPNGAITVHGSIVAGAAPVCGLGEAVVSSLGHNLVSDTSCGFTDTGDQPGTAPLLVGLAENGGPTPTHLPFASSPAVDAIPPGTPGLCDASAPPDQRGVTRPQGPACDVGAVEGDSGTTPEPRALVVDHGGDDADAAPGDGVCQDAGGPAGACSLRAAIGEANAWPGADGIVISPGVDVTLTRTVADTSPDVGDLDITDDLTIDGGGATIDAAGIGGVLSASAADLTLSDATLTGGVGGGGLRYVASGHEVRLTDVTVHGNSATQGGGLYIGAGSAIVERSTISGNRSSMQGGGIHVRTAALTLSDSTVSGNATTATTSVPSKGGGIYVVYGSIQVTRSTIAGNTTPVWGAIYAEGAETQITLAGSVLANPGLDCGGPVVSGGHNLAEDATCPALSQPGDQQGAVPLLGPLADNGGPTWTHLPSTGSPLLDAIPAGTAGLCDGVAATDQRGVTRPQGVGCDVGAVEVALDDPTPVITPGAVAISPEGDSGSTIWNLPVRLSNPSAVPVTIDWATADVATNPSVAHPGSDFAADSGTLTFQPGETVKNIQIEILGDTVDEPPLLWGEWGLVSFSNPANATLDTSGFFGLGLFVIVDDDA